jgi:uncharacterized repeat protein (TIGR02543 family)
MVYTGSATNPVYITALSSNAWITNNTSCTGSLSMIPQGLTDQVNAINLSTASGNVSGNSANGYYNGTQTGNASQLRNEILNPNNWIITNSGAAQQWPIYSFPGSPSVISIKTISSTSIQVVFNSDLDNTSATNINNFTGIANLSSISITNNGSLRDTITLNYSSSFVNSNAYTLAISNISNTNNTVMVCPYSYTFTYNTVISVASNFVVVNENQGNYELVFNITNPSNSSIYLEVLTSPFSTASNNDITLSSQTLQFTGSQSQYFLNIPIVDDNIMEQMAEYLVIAIRNPTACSINGDSLITLYIKDNDRAAPLATNDIELNHIGSFDPSGTNNSTCEVVVYDSASKRLFSTSAISGYLDIIDFSNPGSLNVIQSVNMSLYGGITSVAVYNGIVAVASPNANEQLNGSVVFFDINGNFIKQLEVGALPDMITFTPDGLKVMTANEGQPNDSYTVDPEGTISIINISAGIANLTQNDVTTLNFTQFNSQETTLTGSGVRKTKSSSTLSQDIEPEFITISDDSKKAWVTLQENNAIAEINLLNNTITNIWALGTKNFATAFSGIDASDNNNNILIANWPVNAYYIPDAVANFNINNTNYLITANEGDEKEYAGLNERTTVGNANYILDPTIFPNAGVLKKSNNLGRLRVTNLNGDIDNDGDFDVINCLGSRSFSIWNADSKVLVYDNGDDFEMITASNPLTAMIFNSDNGENAIKGRSRSKGPEPEGVTLADISNKKYAFIALERIGGVMVYDVSNPAAPIFVDYKNSRSTTQYSGDHGPETLIYIPENKSPNGKAYLIVANEISGTLSIFEVSNNNPSTITYHTDGGTHSNPATFTTANLPLTLTNASKTGFTFEGWFDNDSLTGSVITQITTIGNKTLWAKYNVISSLAITRIWSGNANSTWSETANWANGVPATIDNVEIPETAANFPSISAPVTINNLTIESGAQLIQNSTLIINGIVKVKQNISGGQWHFISSPVNNATAYAFSNVNPINAGQTIYLQKYNEGWVFAPATSPWVDITAGWQEILSAGRGYEVWSDNNHTITMEGTQLISTDVVAPISYTGNASYPGYNLIGNPYPSALSVNNFGLWWQNNNGVASMWLWDGANYLAQNGNTNVGDFTTVAPKQAFMVKADVSGASFTIPVTAKTFGGTFLKSTVSDVLKLKISGNGYNDAAYINFNSNATTNYDGQFDVEKIFGIDAAPQFYSSITNKNLSINTLPMLISPVVVPMSLNVGANTTYTITASEMNSFANVITITLEDTKTGTFTNLMQQAVYTFTASTADNANRFKVHFGVNGINENGNGNISIYSNCNVIYINNNSNEVVNEIVVTNVLGQEIFNKKSVNNTINAITIDVASAYYIVKVVTANNVYTEKVYIR